MEQRFKSKPQETIILDKEAIVWEKEGKEIRLKEGLFDVKQIEYINDKAIVKGWFDDQEDKLNKDFSKSKTNIVFPFFQYTYFQSPQKILLKKISPSILQHHTKYFWTVRHCLFDVPTPPPVI